jgi:hypothetical protein
LFSLRDKFVSKTGSIKTAKTRIDVIYKTILRDMKKYFTYDFNREVNFVSRTRRANK